MQRLITSVEIFDALPVRLCPACEQHVDPHRDHDDDTCYLCSQPVNDDQRRRRAEVEIRSLTAELTDLEDVTERTAADLHSTRARKDQLHAQHAELAKLINEERAALLSPFMATLERLAAQIAQLEQKLAAFPAIEEILQRRTNASQTVTHAQQALNHLDNQIPGHAPDGPTSAERCALFAERMNNFLQRYTQRGWIDGSVTISDSDLTFYVGTRPWNQTLGAEASVLFFLAYSYATLFLATDLDNESAFPGLLILDNPYQQGIDAAVVQSALKDLAGAARATGSQVISTQAIPARKLANAREIRMPNVYEATS